MPAALKITLTTSENQTLEQLEMASTVSRRIRKRATALRLNAAGWKVKAIAEYLQWAQSTVRQTIHRWNQRGLVGLWEAEGRGKKPSWSATDWAALEQWLNEPRSHSARQLSLRLATERKVFIGAEQVRRLLKKKVALEKTETKTPSEPKRGVGSHKEERFGSSETVGGTRGNYLTLP